MPYTEMYCDAAVGSNMNGGSDPNTSPSYSATNGGWNAATGVYTPVAGDPSSSVTVGQFANVFLDGATSPVFIGRVNAVTTSTITVSLTARIGTPPATASSGVSINVGGALKGPNGTSAWPLQGNDLGALRNAAGNGLRINLKNSAVYSISAGIASFESGGSGPLTVQGYASSPGDGGRAIIDGGTSGASYTLMIVNNVTGTSQNRIVDIVFRNNGATGSTIAVIGGFSFFHRCVVHSVRGIGFYNGGAYTECEAYACNQSNSTGLGGFVTDSQSIIYAYCISHDNPNAFGFRGSNQRVMHCIRCIADGNGSHGFAGMLNDGQMLLLNCEAFDNGGSGVAFLGARGGFHIQNCNFLKNAGYGINGVASTSTCGTVINCGFGAGSMANALGATNYGATTSVDETGSVTYPAGVSPWAAPATGDFRITLAAARNTGHGGFLQTASSYTGTVGYPDIGAAQSSGTGGAGGVMMEARNILA